MTTISLVTCCWGLDYAEFIPRWWSGVVRLNRKPDEIILGIDPGDPTGLSKSVPEGIKVKIVELPDEIASKKWEFAALQSKSKWWCYMPIDDEILPDAFDEVDKANAQGAEILVDSIVIRQNQVTAQGHWDFTNIATVLPIPGVPIMTIEVMKRIGLKHEFMFGDWIFQIDAKLAGVKVYHAKTRRMIWDAGTTRKTLSSSLNDYKEVELQKIRDYAKANGF